MSDFLTPRSRADAFFANHDTIVAPITAQGRGAVAILRISGMHLIELAQALFKQMPKHRMATHCNFYSQDGTILDEGLMLFFRSPHSFTGEDVLEFQGHGSPILLKRLLDELLKRPNLRLALPGEFSQRAFLNGKMDLTQAEAIADLIAAESEQEASAALNSLKGKFSEIIRAFETQLIAIRARIEASLDFIEEELSDEEKAALLLEIHELKKAFSQLTLKAKESVQRAAKIRLGLIGAPNVGKSSLFNALIDENRAIVSNLAGTTRDFIEEKLCIDDHLFSIIDTAGLRESQDVIEKIGIERTQALTELFQILIWVEDVANPTQLPSAILKKSLLFACQRKIPILGVLNKSDLLTHADQALAPSSFHREITPNWVAVSCKTELGIERLKSLILQLQPKKNEAIEFLARTRHLLILEEGNAHFEFLKEGTFADEFAWDQVADMLLRVQNCLGLITGKSYQEEMLSSIFSSFCLGK